MSAAAPAALASSGPVSLRWRPFSFPLPATLHTAAGPLARRRGWLLRLETAGGLGWGDATPLALGAGLERALEACVQAIEALGGQLARGELERRLPSLPPPLAFALGAALAEADGLVGEAAGGWRPAPPSATLLPAGEGALAAAEAALEAWAAASPSGGAGSSPPSAPGSAASPLQALPGGAVSLPPHPPTLKWKVGVHGEREERAWYGRLAHLLPSGGRLRLDANGGFDRGTAWRWVERLGGDGRLEWLEQPLAPEDLEGHQALAQRLPVALDESLLRQPALRERWSGWQVRRPSQEGDPRPLLRALAEGRPRWMVSTSFETGIGQRWLAHLAALQADGPTPTAPGLAPGWQAPGDLGSATPERVWRAAQAP